MRKLLLLAVLGIGVIVALVSCGRHQETAQRRVYRHSLDEAPTSLDPVHAATVYSNYVIRVAYDTLYSTSTWHARMSSSPISPP